MPDTRTPKLDTDQPPDRRPADAVERKERRDDRDNHPHDHRGDPGDPDQMWSGGSSAGFEASHLKSGSTVAVAAWDRTMLHSRSGGTFAPTPLSTRSQNGGTSEAHMSGNTPAHQNAGAPLAPQPGSTPNRSIIAISFRGCFGA
jgi:hypothetical protein